MVDRRTQLDDLLSQRFFFSPSFEIYGGVAGVYDLGPVGCAMEQRFIDVWRRHYVIEDDMCEIRASMLTPFPVLSASGHAARFADYIVSDVVTRKTYRCDHLIEQFLEQKIAGCKDPELVKRMTQARDAAGDANQDQLVALINDWDVKSPEGNAVSEPQAFNLMFPLKIGPGDGTPGFLRPETAQGIFVNFPRLLEYNRGRLPFACAQIGCSFRNEIAPRQLLVRCREFAMAEIEHFADPDKLDDFPKFDNVAGLRVPLLSAERQLRGESAVEVVLSDAVSQGIICHRTLGYYIGRTWEFLVGIGIIPAKLRFRQHRANEKAHYARDCWDAEIDVNGWLECVGLADRQQYDLTQHTKFSGKDLSVREELAQPRVFERVRVIPKRGEIGKVFKHEGPAVVQALEGLDAGLIGDATSVEVLGKTVPRSMFDVKSETVKETTRSFLPVVIEPSFGIGRILTALWNHAFYLRDDGTRRVLRLPAHMAPYRCVVLPLSARLIPPELISQVRVALKKAGLDHVVDSSNATIGKRYSRLDELGVMFAITLDTVTKENGSVTLRNRDTMTQVRMTLADAVKAIKKCGDGRMTWDEIWGKFEHVVASADDDK